MFLVVAHDWFMGFYEEQFLDPLRVDYGSLRPVFLVRGIGDQSKGDPRHLWDAGSGKLIDCLARLYELLEDRVVERPLWTQRSRSSFDEFLTPGGRGIGLHTLVPVAGYEKWYHRRFDPGDTFVSWSVVPNGQALIDINSCSVTKQVVDYYPQVFKSIGYDLAGNHYFVTHKDFRGEPFSRDSLKRIRPFEVHVFYRGTGVFKHLMTLAPMSYLTNYPDMLDPMVNSLSIQVSPDGKYLVYCFECLDDWPNNWRKILYEVVELGSGEVVSKGCGELVSESCWNGSCSAFLIHFEGGVFLVDVFSGERVEVNFSHPHTKRYDRGVLPQVLGVVGDDTLALVSRKGTHYVFHEMNIFSGERSPVYDFKEPENPYLSFKMPHFQTKPW